MDSVPRTHKLTAALLLALLLVLIPVLFLMLCHSLSLSLSSMPKLEASMESPSLPSAIHNTRNVPNMPVSVAICTLSRSKPSWVTLRQSDPFRFFLRSVSESTRGGAPHLTPRAFDTVFDIALHVGVDDDDPFFVRHGHALALSARRTFGLNLTVYRYPTGTISGLMNRLMQDAADTGAEYLVRLNDDSEITSTDWLPRAVAKLRSFSPTNVGVVGPICMEGNTAILTHDMVHRTHLDVFGTYYPAEMRDWYIDDWISDVYGPLNTARVFRWRVVHHVEGGTRYQPSTGQHKLLGVLVSQGKRRLGACFPGYF